MGTFADTANEQGELERARLLAIQVREALLGAIAQSDRWLWRLEKLNLERAKTTKRDRDEIEKLAGRWGLADGRPRQLSPNSALDVIYRLQARLFRLYLPLMFEEQEAQTEEINEEELEHAATA